MRIPRRGVSTLVLNGVAAGAAPSSKVPDGALTTRPRRANPMDISATVIALLVLSAAAEPTHAPSGPLKPIPITAPDRFDFGTVNPGTLVEHAFKFTNVSRRALTVTGDSVSSGCIRVKSRPNLIKAGATEEIVVTLDTSSLYGRVAPVALVDVTYPKDPLPTPSIALELTGVVRSVWCVPSTIDFGQVVIGARDPSKRQVELSASGYPRVSITKVEADFPGLTVVGFEGRGGSVANTEATLVRKDKDVKSRAIELRWRPWDGAEGSRVGQVRLFTDAKEHPEFKVNLSGSALGSVRLEPPRLFFGTTTAGAVLKRTCRLAPVSPGAVDLLTLRFIADRSGLEVETSQSANGTMQITATLRIAAGNRPGVFKGVIEGKAPDGPTRVSLPYIGYVK